MRPPSASVGAVVGAGAGRHDFHAIAGGQKDELAGAGALLELGQTRGQIGGRHGQALAHLDRRAAMRKPDDDDHHPIPNMARAM